MLVATATIVSNELDYTSVTDAFGHAMFDGPYETKTIRLSMLVLSMYSNSCSCVGAHVAALQNHETCVVYLESHITGLRR